MKRTLGLLATLVVSVATALALALGLTAVPATALPAWQDTASTWKRPHAPVTQVVDLRYASHPRFDRVVIDLHGAIPSGTVHYAKRFFYDGSGEPVPIRGKSGLVLGVHLARAHDESGHDDDYVGPRIARPHLDTLKALALTGDFEGWVTFSFALTHRADYRVFFLHSPQRLVIDFRH